MAYMYKQTFIDSSKYRIKCPYAMTPQYITVHNTANDASAANEVAYHNSNNNEVSYHVAVDDKEVIQCIPFNRNAWHCGDGANGTGNRKSIGIEICYSKSGGERYALAEENAVQYIAKLLHQYGWGLDRVKKHQDWSGKYCPHRILAEKRWELFEQRVQVALEQLKNPIGKYEIVEDKNSKAWRIQSGKYTSKEAAIQAFEKSGLNYATIKGTIK